MNKQVTDLEPSLFSHLCVYVVVYHLTNYLFLAEIKSSFFKAISAVRSNPSSEALNTFFAEDWITLSLYLDKYLARVKKGKFILGDDKV